MVAVHSFSNATLTELREEVEYLRQLRRQLATRLIDAADQLESLDYPPAASLIDELLTCRRRMHRLATALGAEPATGEDEVSLSELERLIEARGYCVSATAVLEQLNDLSHVDIPDFAPLVLCRHEATRLCELASEGNAAERNAELELLKDQRHPLNALIRLCDESDRLSDTEWTECHDDVATTYGRQLATALTRGRIQRQGTAVKVASSEFQSAALPPEQATSKIVATLPVPHPVVAESWRRSVTPTEVAAAVEVSAPVAQAIEIKSRTAALKDATNSVFEPLNESIFDVTPISSSSTARLRTAAIASEIRIEPTGKQFANRELIARTGTSADYVLRLMTEGRLPLALQLARCLDQRSERSDAIPPTWLLRALILGRNLSYSKGEIARQLEDELREFRPEMLTEGSADRQLAMSFLLRAAALPAALLAGSAAATGILRSFRIAPGCSQIYNYCSRVALYGDRLAGNLVELFRPAGAIAGASDLEDLALSTQAWLQETAKKTIEYSRNSPLFLHAHWTLTAGTAVCHADATALWCKWQETFSLAHRLLKPICDRAEGDRNWVRAEIARLTSQVRVEPLAQMSRTGNSQTSTRGILLPLEEMHAVILEAVAIANRWLRLCHQTASGGASPIPLEALELRDEIMKRSDGVLSELMQHRLSSESAAVKAAVSCCQYTVRHIHAMFESRLELPLVEPDPRHVLNADLLRIPGIELNDQWLPESESAVVERELVASLDQAEMTWRQSYDYHAQAGNHEATGRLLELDVWAIPDERDSLRGLRQEQIAESRNSVEAELDELAADITTINDTGAWSYRFC